MSPQPGTFGTCLAELLTTKGCSVHDLAKALDVERSLVYKWRRDERTPHLGSDYVAQIANILKLSTAEREALESSQLATLRSPRAPHRPRSRQRPRWRGDVQRLLDYSPAHQLGSTVSAHHPTVDDDGTRYRPHQQPQRAADWEPRDDTLAACGLASEWPTVRGRMPAMRAVVEIAEAAPPPPASTDPSSPSGSRAHPANTILVTSLEWGGWGDEQARIEHAKQTQAVAMHAIARGWHICHLIRLDKNARRSLATARAVLDVMGTGRYTALYLYASELILPARDLVIIPGFAAIELFATQSVSSVDSAIILRDQQQIEVIQGYFYQIANRAKPLVQMFSPTEWVTYEQVRATAEEHCGAHRLVKDGLSHITEPASWSSPNSPWSQLARHSGQSEEDILALIETRERRFAAFEACVKRHPYRDICPMRAILRLAQEGRYLQNVVVDSHLATPVTERIRHLENVIALLDGYENYELALVDTNQEDEIPILPERFWEVVGEERVFTNMHVRDPRGQAVHAGMLMAEPSLVSAFQQYFDDLWERVAPRNKDKEFVMWWLRQQIASLR